MEDNHHQKTTSTSLLGCLLELLPDLLDYQGGGRSAEVWNFFQIFPNPIYHYWEIHLFLLLTLAIESLKSEMKGQTVTVDGKIRESRK